MSSVTVKLIILTSSDLVRSGIQMLIQTTSSIEVVHASTTVTDCERYLMEHRVDVLLFDDAVPVHLSPHRVLKSLRSLSPGLRILILSDYLSEHYVQRLIDEGAAGFIYKEDQLEYMLVAGIRTVMQGQIFLSPQVSSLPYGNVPGFALNRTDMEVLELIARGYTVQEIGAWVGIVDRSVYRIRGKLRRYLNVRTNEQLVEAARRRGLLKM